MAKRLCYRCMKHMVEDGETCLCGFNLERYLEDTHHLIPGTVLKGRYQVGAAIGEGGFGITYIGMDTLFNQKVAIKEFYIREFVNRNNTVTANVSVITGNSVLTFDNFKAKFISEARTLAKFSKEEGIVSVIDYFEENNTAYIVMEYLEGQTLRGYLKKEQILPWGRTLQILTPVMKSLSKVHAEGIVHRDIAPDNIMLTTDGKVKLLDFGAARVVDSGDLHSRSMVLKQGYAPMEQYRSNGNLQGSWTDVYALCATIYVCVTGVLPEDGMERYIEDHLKPADTLVDCPKEFSDILTKGMAVRYQDRYQTVGELYEAFTTMFKKPELEVKQEEPEEEEKTVFAAKISTLEPAGKPEPLKADVKSEPVQPQPALQINPSSAEEPLKKNRVPQKTYETSIKSRVKKEGAGKKRILDIITKIVVVVILGIAGGKVYYEMRKLPAENDSTLAGTVYRNYDGTIYNYDDKKFRKEYPDELFPIALELDGTHIELPVEFSVFEEMGWEAADMSEMDTILSPGEMSGGSRYSSEYTELINRDNGSRIMVQFWNTTSQAARMDECSVFDFHARLEQMSEDSIVKVGPVVLGETTLEEVKKYYWGYDSSDKYSVFIWGNAGGYSMFPILSSAENSTVISSIYITADAVKEPN